jgi:deazaflavin-dependent oxidoreductase (nitroreductase family)
MRPATKDRLARAVTTAHMAVYRPSGGRVAGRLAGMPVLLLTTRGRTSGRSRTVPLTYLTDGDAIVLVASYGGDDRHPGWYRNLRSDPEVQVTQGRCRRTLNARDATAGERERLWPRVTATYPGYARYQRRTSRAIPLVVLTSPAVPPPPSVVSGR